MITSKYNTGLGLIIFCFAFFIMVSGSAAAEVNTTHMVMNQSTNHKTTELNKITSNIEINNSKPMNLTYKTATK